MTQEKRKVLGRGLESLIPAAARTAGSTAGLAAALATGPAGEAVREIAVEQIERNPYQTRERVDEAALDELAASIAAAGVLQPIVVRPIAVTAPQGVPIDLDAPPRYQLIAGERRWLASQKAGKKTVPALVRLVSNEQAMEMTIIENLQREDLNALEQAKAFDRLSREFRLTQEEMALRTGKTRSSIANYMRLLRMPEIVQKSVGEGSLSFGHAKVLMMLGTPHTITKLTERILRDGLSVRQAEELVEAVLNPKEAPEIEERRVDPNVRAAERTLQEALGVRVRIRDRNGRGKIVIEYGSLEDFDRVIERLGQ